MVNGSTPQGAPTSPTLSNIIIHKFDEIMMGYSKEHNLVYTRYAVDMVISSKEIFDFKVVIAKVKFLLKKYNQKYFYVNESNEVPLEIEKATEVAK